MIEEHRTHDHDQDQDQDTSGHDQDQDQDTNGTPPPEHRTPEDERKPPKKRGTLATGIKTKFVIVGRSTRQNEKK